MHLLIVRHGECVGQVETVFSTPDTVLTQHGAFQAQQTARHLAKESITQVLSSPLVRALETASILAAATSNTSFTVWSELREGFSSTHRGFGRAELLRQFPCAVLPDDITTQGWDHGGDTYESLFARCQATLHRIQAQFGPDDRVAMVTHGGFGNYLLHAILGIAPATPQWFDMDNCAIHRVRFVPNPSRERPNWPLYPPVKVEILRLNDVSHLTSAPRPHSV